MINIAAAWWSKRRRLPRVSLLMVSSVIISCDTKQWLMSGKYEARSSSPLKHHEINREIKFR